MKVKRLIVTLLLCSCACHASQAGTYVVDANGIVTVDRDIKQDDLKIEVKTDTFSSKGMFDNLKGWFK